MGTKIADHSCKVTSTGLRMKVSQKIEIAASGAALVGVAAGIAAASIASPMLAVAAVSIGTGAAVAEYCARHSEQTDKEDRTPSAGCNL